MGRATSCSGPCAPWRPSVHSCFCCVPALRWRKSGAAFSQCTPPTARPRCRSTRKRRCLPRVLDGGFTPVYPCHVPPGQMRQHPIGTGPFKFVEFKPNEHIRVARNPDYWKPELPYLDGIEYTVIRNPATAVLSFVSGQLD